MTMTAINNLVMTHSTHSCENSKTIVAVYVYDLITIAKTPEEMKHLKNNLLTGLKIKDIGKFHYCLGIAIEQDQERRSV